MLNKIRKLSYFLFLLFINISLFAVKFSEISGIKKLSNYNEIKNIEVSRIFEKKSGTSVFNRINGLAYPKNENKVFSGVLIARENNNIVGLYQYNNGKLEGIVNDYYENGQIHINSIARNDKIEGKTFIYYPDGKLQDYRIFENDIIIKSTEYNKNGKIKNTLTSTGGLNAVIILYYENEFKSAEIEVIQDYSNRKEEIKFIKNGKTTVYERNGNILGELNFNNGSLLGERQKLYKNGKLKYDFIGGTKDIKGLKAMRSYIEYYDNSDIMKYSCDEVSKDNWKCKEYSKDGSFKQNVDGKKYVSVNNNHHGNIWVNIFLGAWNILNP